MLVYKLNMKLLVSVVNLVTKGGFYIKKMLKYSRIVGLVGRICLQYSPDSIKSQALKLVVLEYLKTFPKDGSTVIHTFKYP